MNHREIDAFSSAVYWKSTNLIVRAHAAWIKHQPHHVVGPNCNYLPVETAKNHHNHSREHSIMQAQNSLLTWKSGHCADYVNGHTTNQA